MDIDNINKMSLKELVSEIEKHNKLYWKKNAPEISDDEYDLLMQRLEELNPDHPLLKLVGTTKVASIGKVSLSKPMISLDKTYFFKDEDIPCDKKKGKKSLLKWAEENSRNENELFLIQPKYDGISACYFDGILATRGQGTEDENVTDKVPLIELETVGYKGPLDRDVRGEIIIRNDDFKNIYSKIVRVGGKTYKNSRNAVGGIMGLKDISDMLRQRAKLTLIDYDMISFKVKFKDIEKEWAKIVEELEELPYPMDGIVVKLADEDYSESLGYTAHHPRGQIAFKFSGVRKKTKLIGIEWSFGKNCLTPVGKVEPVEIGGVTISNVTLHNVANLEEKDLQIGDIVTVERAGDVIPHIVESEPGENRRNGIITNCPCCKFVLVRESKELRCVNKECFEINLQKILAAVRNIGIEELGEPNIRKMMNVLGVKKLADIFNFTIDDILKLEGFKQKSATNLYNSIQKARNTTDYQLLAALNIQGIGQTAASKILSDYTLEEIRKMNRIELAYIPEIGSELSEKLYSSLLEQSDTLDDLISVLNVTPSKIKKEPNDLVCFDIESDMTKKPLSHYEKLLKANNLNRVKPVKEGGVLYLPKKLKVLVTTRKPDSKNALMLKAKETGAKILSPGKWEESLKNKTATAETIEKTICFTGEMPEKRSYYEAIAQNNGYKPVDTVSKDLSMLVTADKDSGSSKMKKAKASGVEIITLDEWLMRIKGVKIKKEDNPKKNDGFLPGF